MNCLTDARACQCEYSHVTLNNGLNEFRFYERYILKGLVKQESVKNSVQHRAKPKLQALVYDVLSSTTAVFSYAIGSRNSQLTSSFSLVLKQ